MFTRLNFCFVYLQIVLQWNLNTLAASTLLDSLLPSTISTTETETATPTSFASQKDYRKFFEFMMLQNLKTRYFESNFYNNTRCNTLVYSVPCLPSIFRLGSTVVDIRSASKIFFMGAVIKHFAQRQYWIWHVTLEYELHLF